MNALPLIPALPLCAALLLTAMRFRARTAATVAILAQAGAFGLALVAFVGVIRGTPASEDTTGVEWLPGFGIGFLADPLSASTALMVAFVSLLVFTYSAAYMAEDPRAARFFAFLSLFSGAMLGLVLSGDLLLLFICWELVGLASYLLIGFWFQKPEAAAAARKAFLTTRIGDVALLAAILWLAGLNGGNLRFYDGGSGCLEWAGGASPLLPLGLVLLLFLGAMAKSGQFPLHIWLPDAMEGPTPVSALIHAATMVAAGVFLVARTFPLFDGGGANDPALAVVAWTGAFTALFAALIAVAQNDLKRILAYSTVSQLGFMMLALGVAGPAVAMLHLVGHAFFKALLFLGAGSVIHGAGGEQDIRRLGGLRRAMPVTFATYAVGMMALSGVPVLFCGFWSKDAILHAAHAWPASHGPFALACAAAFLTALYMTRQLALVFFGNRRASGGTQPHESPALMLAPLGILAAATILFSVVATPAWPWFEQWIAGGAVTIEATRLLDRGFLAIAGVSSALAAAGIGLGWGLYGRRGAQIDPDPIARRMPVLHRALANRLYVDELFSATVVRWTVAFGRLSAGCDRWIWNGGMRIAAAITRALALTARGVDEAGINEGFDRGCESLRTSGSRWGRAPGGNAITYLRIAAGGAAILLVLVLLWTR